MNAEELRKMRRRILVIDDNPHIHEDIRKIICPAPEPDDLAEDASFLFGVQSQQPKSTNVPVEVDCADQGQQGLAMVEQAMATGEPYMMAFVDMRMPPGWDGLETVQNIWKVSPSLQVVICTAYSDKPWEEINARLGTSANLLILKKPFDNVEILQLVQTLTEKWILTKLTERRLGEMEVMVEERTFQMVQYHEELELETERASDMEKALSESEERFHKAFDSALAALAILRADTFAHIEINASYLDLVGIPRSQVIGRTLEELRFVEKLSGLDTALAALKSKRAVRNMEISIGLPDGKTRNALVSIVPMTIENKPFLLLTLNETTALRQLEADLRQVQKLDSIGQLAGGVAHDFNNILAAMTLQLSFLREIIGPESEALETARDVEAQVERAANLTRQLLIFSRRQTVRLEPLNLSLVVESVLRMLGRLLGARIEIQFVNQTQTSLIKADTGMMEQVLMNLAVNARDAMSGDGLLTININDVEFTGAENENNPERQVGKFVCLSVTDTGTGMDENTLKKIFEPFFTTKPVGKGTGLGLPTVYGIVKQHNGWIHVDSLPGRGSTFLVYLPAYNGQLMTQEVTPAPRTVPRGQGTVLLVEDETGVRLGLSLYLRRLGYDVLEAVDADEAVQCWQTHRDQIGLLYTDVVIPGAYSGLDLAQKLKGEKNSLKIIVSSGYSIEITSKNFPSQEGFVYLPKPSSSEVIADTVYACFSHS